MEVKRPQVLAQYRAGAQAFPSAHTDARILAAARATPAPVQAFRHGFIAFATAAAIAAVFLIRITTTPALRSAENNFGMTEGRDGVYLMTFDFNTHNAPGSREGLP